LAPKAAVLFNQVSTHFNHGMVGDLTEATYLFMSCALISVVLGLVFLVLMCLCAGVVAWLLVIGLIVTLIALGVSIILNVYNVGHLNDSINALRVKYLDFMIENEAWVIATGVILIVLGVVLFLYVVTHCK